MAASGGGDSAGGRVVSAPRAVPVMAPAFRAQKSTSGVALYIELISPPSSKCQTT